MNRLAKTATWIVLLNLVINSIHGYTHSLGSVGLEPWQQVFVVVTILLLPIVAMILYWTPYQKPAALLLTVTMVAGTLFGIYFHFIADTFDHVSHREADANGIVFVVSAVLLIPAGLLGAWFGWWSWRQLSNSQA